MKKNIGLPKYGKSNKDILKQIHPDISITICVNYLYINGIAGKLGLIPKLFGKQYTISCIEIKGKLMTLKQTFSVQVQCLVAIRAANIDLNLKPLIGNR